MKKYCILILFFICFSINTYQAINKNNCTNEIVLNDVNSKNLTSYIRENKLEERVSKVCSKDICITINPSSIERDIKNFIEKNINYLKKVNEEIAIDAEIKGFKVEKIIFYSC